MGSHGSGEESEAWLEDSGLWWQDRLVERTEILSYKRIR
jgi:hypothetical protein